MLLGIALCVVGTITITAQGGALAKPGESVFLGVFFVCIHSAGQSLYVIYQPHLLSLGYSPFTINSVAFLVATGFMTMLLLVPHPKIHQGIYWETSPFFIGITLYSIFLVGAYSYTVMGWAAKQIGGTAVMLFMLLQAFLTTVAGRFFLQETMTITQVFGGLLILIGILIYVFGKGFESSSTASSMSKVPCEIIGPS